MAVNLEQANFELLEAQMEKGFPEPVESFVNRFYVTKELEELTKHLNDLAKEASATPLMMAPGGGTTTPFSMVDPRAGSYAATGGASAQGVPMGEVHRWKDGNLYKKTEQGWIPYNHEKDTVDHEKWGEHYDPQFHSDDVPGSGAGEIMTEKVMQKFEVPPGIKGTNEALQRISDLLGEYERMVPDNRRKEIADKKKNFAHSVLTVLRTHLEAVLRDKLQSNEGGKVQITGELNSADLHNLGVVAEKINEVLGNAINSIQEEMVKNRNAYHKESSEGVEESFKTKPGEVNKRDEDPSLEDVHPSQRHGIYDLADALRNLAYAERIDDADEAAQHYQEGIQNVVEAMKGLSEDKGFQKTIEQFSDIVNHLVQAYSSGDEGEVKLAKRRLRVLSQSFDRMVQLGEYRAQTDPDKPDRYWHGDRAHSRGFDEIRKYVESTYPDANKAMNLYQRNSDGGAMHSDGDRKDELLKKFHGNMSRAGSLLENAYRDYPDKEPKTMVEDLLNVVRYQDELSDLLKDSGYGALSDLADMLSYGVTKLVADLHFDKITYDKAHFMLGHLSDMANGMRTAMGDDLAEKDGDTPPPNNDHLDFFQQMLEEHPEVVHEKMYERSMGRPADEEGLGSSITPEGDLVSVKQQSPHTGRINNAMDEIGTALRQAYPDMHTLDFAKLSAYFRNAITDTVTHAAQEITGDDDLYYNAGPGTFTRGDGHLPDRATFQKLIDINFFEELANDDLVKAKESLYKNKLSSEDVQAIVQGYQHGVTGHKPTNATQQAPWFNKDIKKSIRNIAGNTEAKTGIVYDRLYNRMKKDGATPGEAHTRAFYMVKNAVDRLSTQMAQRTGRDIGFDVHPSESGAPMVALRVPRDKRNHNALHRLSPLIQEAEEVLTKYLESM